MNWSKRTWISVVSLVVVAGGMAIAQNWRGHPNLAAADQATRQAIQSLHAAQRANHWDMAGHAAHAEQLLRQAEGEIRAAAIAANH
jgi:hypothetical protein